MAKRHIVVLSGAGMSAESGIKTFRDSDGLWENYPVQDVASIDGWYRDPKLIINFYNMLRKQLQNAKPNRGHELVASLESDFKVSVITQNIDNLHERAGSTSVLHLHGQLTKAQSTYNPELIKEIGYEDMKYGDKAPDGGLWRPHIVWFGEAVPNIEPAAELVQQADILLVIGTSLNVYPAAGLLYYASAKTPIYLIDPKPATNISRDVHVIADVASKGMEQFCKDMEQYK